MKLMYFAVVVSGVDCMAIKQGDCAVLYLSSVILVHAKLWCSCELGVHL